MIRWSDWQVEGGTWKALGREAWEVVTGRLKGSCAEAELERLWWKWRGGMERAR